MVVVTVTDPNTKEESSFYLDGKLKTQLDKIRKRIQKKDSDYVLIIDGEEGSGKSVFAMQICKYVDPTFNTNRVYFNGNSFHEGVIASDKCKAHQFDEAFIGLSSRTALSEINHLLNSLIMQMRQKNLFVCIVLPSIFILDKYPAMFRSKALIHIYFRNGKRGNFVVFNRRKKNQLILKGKKEFSYMYVKSGFRGRFTDKYVIPEQEYRDKKLQALQEKPKHTKQDEFKARSDYLSYLLHKKHNYPAIKISKLLKQNGMQLDNSYLSRLFRNFSKNPVKLDLEDDIL